MASVMRMLAWWGTKASRSSGTMPAAVMVRAATGAMEKTAQRKTDWPCISMAGQVGVSCPGCGWSIAGRRSVQAWRCTILSQLWPSEPATVGPMPGKSEGPTTAAPAPSPKMNAVPRSVGLVKSLSFSTPTTSTYCALPARIMSLAMEMP
jgi:hypothetical protein